MCDEALRRRCEAASASLRAPYTAALVSLPLSSFSSPAACFSPAEPGALTVKLKDAAWKALGGGGAGALAMARS